MGIYDFLASRGLHPDHADISDWPHPGIDENGVDQSKTLSYITLNKGLELYCANHGSFEKVALEIGVHKTTLSRAVGKCFTRDDVGNFIGRSGLIKWLRVNGYVRVTESESNYSGIFNQLLERTGIEADLVKVINGEHAEFSAVRQIDIHEVFCTLLTRAGASVSRYPYTVKNKGKNGLAAFVKRVREKKPLRGVKLCFGPAAAKKIGRAMTDDEEFRRYVEPYELVEIDAHRIDGIIILTIIAPDGVPIDLPLKRIWLIVVLEVKATAVLGYSLAFGENPTKDDIAEAITRSIVPQERLNLTIPDLAYHEVGGFPASDIDGCAYRLPTIYSFDNEQAHWSNDLHEDLCFKGGGIVHIGEGYHPDGRPNVENIFNTIEEDLFHQFKNTTGSGPNDHRRQNAEEAAIRYRFDYDVLLQALDTYLFRKNGVAPPGAVRAAPIIHLERAIQNSDMLARRVPPDERRNWTMHEAWEKRTVQGGGSRKAPPYVQIKEAEYTSERLRNRWDLLGEEVLILLNRKDSLRVKMFLADGSYFDTLLVERRFRVPHSFWVRSLYIQIMKQNEHAPREYPTQVVFRHLSQQARSCKKSRNQLQRLLLENPELATSFAEYSDSPVEESEDRRVPTPTDERDQRLDNIVVPFKAF
jgi:putative transposase